MNKTRVGIVGYGTIGKRVADAVMLQPDMELSGVTVHTFNYRIRLAQENGIRLYSLDGDEDLTKHGLTIIGGIKELIANSDVIVDCSSKPIGKENKANSYVPLGIKAIFQGGEKANVAEASFVAQCNYDRCVGLNYVRVVSCNTTGLARTIGAIDKAFGAKKARVTLIRRATDPWDAKKGPIDAIVPDLELPTHHGPDLQTIMPHIDIITSAVIVPTTLMHLHTVTVQVKKIPTKQEIIKALTDSGRIRIVRGADGITATSHIMDFARDRGTKRGDMMEICVWEEGINVVGDEIFYHQAVHQESDVVPENIDAIRAVMGFPDGKKSIEMTNKALGM